MNQTKVAAIEKLYARLPKIACKQFCHDYCGAVAMTEIEAKRIEKKVHRRLPVLLGPGLSCSLLSGTRCTVYALRPLICRLWGVVETMRCPHGCQPSRMLTKEEGFRFLEEIGKISPLTEQSVAAVGFVNEMRDL